MTKRASPASISNRLILYGVFLLTCGLIGNAIVPEGSPPGIINGIASGALMIVLGVIYRSGRPWTLPASLSATGIFTLTFVWRAAVQWYAVVADDRGHIPIAILLTLMVLVSCLMIWNLARKNLLV